MSKTGKRSPRTAQRPDDSDDEAKDLRPLCGALRFWRVCGKPPCRRASACMGDAQACFRQFWWQLPEEARVWVRAAIAASAGGMTKKAAAVAANAEVARWQELQQRYAPKTAHEAAPTQAAAPTQPHDSTPAPMPRIRML